MEIGRIYIVSCLVTGKVYIGQTINSIEHRWASHVKASKRKDTKFYRAIRKYGSDNFRIEEVMWVEAPTKQVLKAKLDFLEIHFIQKFDTRLNGYNSTEGGEKGTVGFRFSKESRDKMSKAKRGRTLSEEHRRKLSEAHLGKTSPMKGKTVSNEVRKRISEAMSGKNHPFYGVKRSEETRRKMSEARKLWHSLKSA